MSIAWCNTCKRFHVGPCRLIDRPMAQPPLLNFKTDQEHKHAFEMVLLNGCRVCKRAAPIVCPDCFCCRFCTLTAGGCPECCPERFPRPPGSR